MMGKTGVRHSVTQNERISQPVIKLRCGTRSKHNILQCLKLRTLLEYQWLFSAILISIEEILRRAHHTKILV